MAQRCACPSAATLNHRFSQIACLFCLVCSVEAGSTAAQNAIGATTMPHVASGTVFVTSLKRSAHVEKLKTGDKVDFDSLAATLVGGRTVIPEKAVFHGHVLQSVPAKGDPEKISHLSILVDSVTWKDKSLPVCASIVGFGSRQLNVRYDQVPQAGAIAVGGSPDWIKRQAVAENRTGVDLSDRNFGLVQRMPDAFTFPESSITIYGEGFVKGVTIQQSATSASVLNRKNKNVDLPGGLLVALKQIDSESACSAQIVP